MLNLPTLRVKYTSFCNLLILSRSREGLGYLVCMLPRRSTLKDLYCQLWLSHLHKDHYIGLGDLFHHRCASATKLTGQVELKSKILSQEQRAKEVMLLSKHALEFSAY